MSHPFIKAFLVFFACTAISFATKPLTVWTMPNGATPQDKLEHQLEKFTQKTGIKTQIQVLDWGVAWNRISLALAGKIDAPDVLQLGTSWIPYFASRKELKPLNPWLDKIDSSRFIPASWNTTKIDSDSIVYSVPWFVDIRSILGNKRIMKKNGITRESVATYEGFVEAVRKVNENNETLDYGIKVRAYAFPGKSDWNIPHNFAPWIWSSGGDFIATDSVGKKHANILSPKTLDGIAMYLRFVLDSLVSPECLQNNTAQVTQEFNAGEIAFIASTSEVIMQTRFDSNVGGLSNAKIGSDSIEVLPVPTGSAGSIAFIGGSNLAIPATNKRPESIELLRFLTNDENQDEYTKHIGLLPSSKKVLETWKQDEAYSVLVKALETGRTYTPIPEWGSIEQSLVSMFSEVWDLMEIHSLYSDEKLYQIFRTYSDEINKTLGYIETAPMTQAEFQKIWNKIIHHSETGSAQDENHDQEIIRDNLRKAPYIFTIMILLGFVFSLKSKRKR